MSISGKRSLQPKFRVLFAAALILNLTACSNTKLSGLSFFSSSPLFSSNFPPPGPENYRGGMVDGCKTAMTAISPATPYGFTNEGYVFNASLGLTDETYYKAWKDGYNYCKGQHHYYQS